MGRRECRSNAVLVPAHSLVLGSAGPVAVAGVAPGAATLVGSATPAGLWRLPGEAGRLLVVQFTQSVCRNRNTGPAIAVS